MQTYCLDWINRKEVTEQTPTEITFKEAMMPSKFHATAKITSLAAIAALAMTSTPAMAGPASTNGSFGPAATVAATSCSFTSASSDGES